MPQPFRGETEVPPGEKRQFRVSVSETYLGDPVELPITVINGAHDGPTIGLTAAVHGDELNGVKVLQEVADRYDPADIHGTVVCFHVVNVPGYLAQQRDIPIYDIDLNRSFPGKERANTGERIANVVYQRGISHCDLVVDFHTSTRNRTTMYHVRADTDVPDVSRLAHAFGANVILSGSGEDGALRTVATRDGIPTITVEMGEAHRFQEHLIEKALGGVESVFAEYAVSPTASVDWPGWTKIIDSAREKTWLRADTGGIVDMQYEYPLVYEGDTICTVSDHFKADEHVVTAPFTGLIVGVLRNPVALPGHPLCHIVRIDDATRREIEAEIDRGEFDNVNTRMPDD